MVKFIIQLVAMVAYTVLLSRMWYIRGVKDTEFDRERANYKLQKCIDVIKGGWNEI